VISGAERIDQPYSGEYTERIYDIDTSWHSSDWTWIKFFDDDEVWCGNFRGKYKGVVVSEKMGIAVVLTSDHLYVLDVFTADIVDFIAQSNYVDITITPFGDILVTDGYDIEKFTHNRISDFELISTPIKTEFVRFKGWDGNVLKISCNEFLIYDELELKWDCVLEEWIS